MQRITDTYGRTFDYLRLAVTDRCNMRCFYCMPADGIQYLPRKELLSYEEMLFILQSLSELGVKKVRITGGEPFLRKDLIHFLGAARKIQGIQSFHITSNGFLIGNFIDDLKRLGINDINLSLDSLDPHRFAKITRTNHFLRVRTNLDRLIKEGFNLKINMVAMQGLNDQDIPEMASLAKDYNLTVRFIEEMPFNGEGVRVKKWELNHREIFSRLSAHFPEIKQSGYTATSQEFSVDGFKGKIGIIAAWSRTFCQTCNRIRITPEGVLKNCLYDHGVFNLKQFLRNGASKADLQRIVIESFKSKAKNGIEAEALRRSKFPILESMTTIGG